MAKRGVYKSEKRKKELSRSKKQEEKRKKRLEKSLIDEDKPGSENPTQNDDEQKIS